MNTLNKNLRDKAVLHGLCQDWQNGWRDDKTMQQLIDMYKRGIDFCFEHRYPTVEFIKGNFDRELLISNNIFVDEEVDKKNPERNCVIIGKSTGVLNFDKFSTSDIYINDDSSITISASGFSRVSVNVYGNSTVHAIQSGNAKIYVYLHGENHHFTYEGSVMVRNSE